MDDLNTIDEKLAVPEIMDNDPFVSHKRACAEEATQPRWKSLRRKVTKALATVPAEAAEPSPPPVPTETPYQQDVRQPSLPSEVVRLHQLTKHHSERRVRARLPLLFAGRYTGTVYSGRIKQDFTWSRRTCSKRSDCTVPTHKHQSKAR